MPKRPTSVLVIAIFHFILGGLGFLSGVFQLTGGAAQLQKAIAVGDPQQARIQENLQRGIEEQFPGYKLYEKVEGGVGLLIGVLLLTAGVGLLKMRPWAWTLSVVYAVLGILNTIVAMVVAFLFVVPATRAALREIPNLPPQMSGIMEASLMGGVFLGGCIGLIYPVAVLIVMSLSGVRQAFRAAAGGGFLPREDDEDHYEPGERWRDLDK